MSGLVALLFVVAATITGAVSATADPTDGVDYRKIDYRVDEQGLLHVTETLAWHSPNFPEGERGSWLLKTREPVGESQDSVYGVSDIELSGPDADVAPRTYDHCSTNRRFCFKDVSIGGPRHEGPASTTTYTLSYVVAGAIRHVDDHDELHWTTLSTTTLPVDTTQLEVTAPGGVQQITCHMTFRPQDTPPEQMAKEERDCSAAAIEDGRAVVTQDMRSDTNNSDVVVAFAPGLVADNQPHLEKAPPTHPDPSAGIWKGLLIGLVSAVAMFVVVQIVKRRRADAPAPVEEAPASDGPVEYRQPPSVPDLPVALSGLLLDGRVGTVEVLAVLVDLSVRGITRIEEWGAGVLRLRLFEPGLLQEEWEKRLIRALFGKYSATGGEVIFLDQIHIVRAGKVLFREATRLAVERGLVKRRGWGFWDAGRFPRILGRIFWVLFLPLLAGIFWLRVWGPEPRTETDHMILSGGTTVAVVLVVGGIWFAKHASSAQLTAAGSAAAAQIRAYRDQLCPDMMDRMVRESSLDTFSANLPWAIAVGEEQNWVNIGSVPTSLSDGNGVPDWYRGSKESFRGGLFFVPLITDPAVMTVSFP